MLTSSHNDSDGFMLQAGYYWFSLIDYYIGGFPLLIIGFCETTVLCYVYGYCVCRLYIASCLK